MTMRYRNLSGFITELMAYQGAIAEKKEDDSIELIATPEISQIINIPEYSRLTFKSSEISDDCIYASYDSDFFQSLISLFADRGRFGLARFEQPAIEIKKVKRIIPDNFALQNAAYKLKSIEYSNISYLLVYFHYIALSDEKHEGIVPILINEMNLASIQHKTSIEGLKDVQNPGSIDKISLHRSINAAFRTASSNITEVMDDFKKSLNRRLNRDIKRVFEYFQALEKQTELAFKKRNTAKNYAQNTGTNDEEKILMLKLNAIRTEKKLKIQDLITKYTLTIKIKPLSALKIQVYTPVLQLKINRRLSSRIIPLAYNPFLKQIESLPCESCFYPRGGYNICDEKLHIICSSCYILCPDCSKHYCSLCYSACPKCKPDTKSKGCK